MPTTSIPGITGLPHKSTNIQGSTYFPLAGHSSPSFAGSSHSGLGAILAKLALFAQPSEDQLSRLRFCTSRPPVKHVTGRSLGALRDWLQGLEPSQLSRSRRLATSLRKGDVSKKRATSGCPKIHRLSHPTHKILDLNQQHPDQRMHRTRVGWSLCHLPEDADHRVFNGFEGRCTVLYLTRHYRITAEPDKPPFPRSWLSTCGASMYCILGAPLSRGR